MPQCLDQRGQRRNGEGRRRVGPARRVTSKKPKLDCTEASTSPHGPACLGAQLRQDGRLRPASYRPVDGRLDAGSGDRPQAGGVGEGEAPLTGQTWRP